MFIALRYLVTVRRATVTPWAARSWTNCSSLFGCCLSSPSINSCSFRRIGVPGHLFAVGAHRAAAEEPLQREDAARRLNPLVVDRPAHRGDVHAHLVGDLLHLQRLDRFRALVEKLGLVIDDRLGHPRQRAAALLDRVDQPLGRIDLALDVFARLLVGLAAGEKLAIVRADE